ncbi:hypothetical protein GYA19_00255 [Candidatus Beckwithbacteria bacterium]|nr:hypothetical protein [Candidatus Beckwithbacteria bacterium]
MFIKNGVLDRECYQVNKGVQAIYDDKKKQLISLTLDRKTIKDDKFYTICMQGYHLNNCQNYFNISEKELLATWKHKVVSTSAQDVLEEYLKNHQNIDSQIEERLVYQS